MRNTFSIETFDDAEQAEEERQRIFKRRVTMNVEAEEHARQVRLRVERRAGELLREMPKHPPGGSVIACDRSPSEIIRPRHHQKRNHRIGKRLAAIPKGEFEAAVRNGATSESRGVKGKPKWSWSPSSDACQ